jgi:hypothetical protein
VCKGAANCAGCCCCCGTTTDIAPLAYVSMHQHLLRRCNDDNLLQLKQHPLCCGACAAADSCCCSRASNVKANSSTAHVTLLCITTFRPLAKCIYTSKVYVQCDAPSASHYHTCRVRDSSSERQAQANGSAVYAGHHDPWRVHHVQGVRGLGDSEGLQATGYTRLRPHFCNLPGCISAAPASAVPPHVVDQCALAYIRHAHLELLLCVKE